MEHDVVDSIEPIASEWDELAARAQAAPFLRPGWFRAWRNAFGRGRLEILTVRRGGRLAGVAPLQRRRGTLSAVANVHSPAFAFLAEDAAVERALVERLYGPRPLHTSLCFLDRDASGTVELDRQARRAGRRLLEVVTQCSPYVEIDGSWGDYERSLQTKFVRDLRRRRRQLDALGTVAIEVADGSERLDDLLAEAFRLEPSGWKAKRGTAIVSDPRTLRFYREIAAWAAEQGFLRLAFLRLDGKPLALQYALDDGVRWYFLKGGIDPDAGRFGPGKLLVHEMLRRAFGTGLDSFEFLGADEAWKGDWRSRRRELVLQHSFPPTPLGLGWRSAIAAWRTIGLPLARRTVEIVR